MSNSTLDLRWGRRWTLASKQLNWIAAIVFVLFLVVPLGTWSRRWEYLQEIQFSAFCFGIPALLAIRKPSPNRYSLVSLEDFFRLASFREHVQARVRWSSITAMMMLSVVVWRLSPVVNAEVRHPWLSVVGALCLGFIGFFFFRVLYAPFENNLSPDPLFRLVMATVVMWTIWTMAYLGALSNGSWYRAFHHQAGHGISLTADQQLGAAVLWLLSASAFLPVIFFNLMRWLRAEEDPRDSRHHFARREGSQGW